MASLAIFEDQLAARMNIHMALEDSSHTIVGEAASSAGAHELLKRLALGELHADYALVDGSLEHSVAQPKFCFTPAKFEFPKSQPKKWRQFHRKPVVNTHEIIIESDTTRMPGADGRQIIQIIRACKLPIVTIGVSGVPAHEWGGEVDHDLTKLGVPHGLLNLIEQLEENKSDLHIRR